MDEQPPEETRRRWFEHRVGVGGELILLIAQQRLDVGRPDLDDQHVQIGTGVGSRDPDLADLGIGHCVLTDRRIEPGVGTHRLIGHCDRGIGNGVLDSCREGTELFF